MINIQVLNDFIDPDKQYEIVKEKATSHSNVRPGAKAIGYCGLVESQVGYHVLVLGVGMDDYLRTSPVIDVLEVTKDKALFQTEGGTYSLKVIKDEETD